MSISSRRNAGVTIILIVASFFSAHLCFSILPSVFEPWNAQATDQLFVLRSSIPLLRPHYDNTVVHVDLNNSTILRLNNFYLNRSHYARLMENLAAMGTAVQAYDFIFAARSNAEDDEALISATKDAGNVYFGIAFGLVTADSTQVQSLLDEASLEYLRATRWVVPSEPAPSEFFTGSQPLPTFIDLARHSRGLGFISIKSDVDGVFRRVPLLVKFQDGYYPSLPFRVACDYLGVSPGGIRITPGRAIVLKDAHKPGAEPHDITIPIDAQGSMRINILGPWETMDHYNFADIYRASQDSYEMGRWKKELAGKIVVVSDVSTGSTDIGPVPADVNFPLSGLHANVIHTLLTESFPKEFSLAEMLPLEAAIAVVLLTLALRFSSLSFLLSSVGLALAYAAGVAFAFLYGNVLLHLVRPLFFIGFSLVSITAYRYFKEEQEKLALRKSFEAYFAPSVVKKIMNHPEMISNRGEKKELTILFSDIKSFTTHSAHLSPDQIRKSLNDYFEAMVEIVFKHGGTVDKYIGDGLMVFFGDPEPQPDHALRCVRAAMEMQQKVRQQGRESEPEGSIPIQIRIGINTGEVVVGNMGSTRRLSYTVLGAAVNLAQRLESNAPVGGILISQRTYEWVKGDIVVENPRQIQVKGIDVPVSVYEVSLPA